jgi:hypothetical protein
VNDPAVVNGLHDIDQLLRHRHCGDGRETTRIRDGLAKGRPFLEVHDKVAGAILLKPSQNVHDVGVVECGQRSGFFTEIVQNL